MKKAMLDVELMSKDRVVFAYCCVGVETRRNLYVKVDTDQYVEKPYIKIQKKDTKVSAVVCTIDFDTYREVEVFSSVGLEDDRLQSLEDEKMIKAVDEVMAWYRKEIEKITA